MKIFVSVTCLFLLVASAAQAEVYSWTDESGKVHYSTTPRSSADTPAELPKVKRENITTRIERIREKMLETCQAHGGIDCSRIDDRDGSVVCHDGYMDARLPFIQSCSQAEVATVGFWLTRADGEEVTLPLRLRSRPDYEVENVTVRLRNTAGVAAENVSVDIVPAYSRALSASGPKSIPAFSAVDYTLAADMLSDLLVLRDISFRVHCANCKTIRKRVTQ